MPRVNAAPFSAADWVVVGIYLAAVALVALYVSPGQGSTREYFLGGRTIPWWAAALSIIATETSAVTYIGIPREAYAGDWSFLQLVIGFVAGRLFLAFFFVPVFYRHEVVTVYGYLERRFGGAVRTTAAVLFLLGRVIGSAVRLFAGCLALEVALGWPLEWTIIGLGAFGTLYTIAGGIRAVVWTDVLLGLTFIAGGLIATAYILADLPGGLEGILSDPDLPQKTRVFHAALDFTRSDTLLAGLAGGFVLTLATHGTDQDIVQRILTCRDARRGGLSLAASAVMILPLMALFLAVGTLLFFHGRGSPPPADLNQAFPRFIVTELPAGIRGLVMAGLLAASISSFTSVLNALASTIVTDFYRPLRARLAREAAEGHLVLASRLATLASGIAVIALAVAFRGSKESVVNLALQVLTYFYGALLGAFLLGIFTRRGTGATVVAGMLASVPAVLLLQVRQLLEDPALAPSAARGLLERLPAGVSEWIAAAVPLVAWPYWIIIGTAVTVAVGAIGSRTAVIK
jgi:SSS family transporter